MDSANALRFYWRGRSHRQQISASRRQEYDSPGKDSVSISTFICTACYYSDTGNGTLSLRIVLVREFCGCSKELNFNR